jgi:hypothetical protein
LTVVTPVGAHQVDEYLQATILSVDKTRIRADMFLTPGVAVLPVVLADIDVDRDGLISPAEQRSYAERVLRDLSLTLDGVRLTPQLGAVEFPSPEEMKAGRGDIHLEFSAPFPSSGSGHKLRLGNHHQSSIAAYQVNCLIPDDPGIKIGEEHRSYSQAVYELEFTAAGTGPTWLGFGFGSPAGRYLGVSALLLLIGALLSNTHTGWRLARLRPHPKVN